MTSTPAWLERALGFETLETTLPEFAAWLPQARTESLQRLFKHGDFRRWLAAIAALPDAPTEPASLDCDVPSVGQAGVECAGVESSLQALGPWRKGPFSVHGVEVDAEWRCFLKWQRVLDVAEPFAGQRVLDVGSGNGYFLLRLLGAGAKLALGVEPSVLYTAQYLALARSFAEKRLALLPVGVERLPQNSRAFDSVLSMGVLYHRRAPLEHLAELRGFLRSGGQLVLETLVVDGPRGQVLVPQERYAQMRNVWNIPSVDSLVEWLEQSGYADVRLGAVTPTTAAEQRSTSWMPHPSLSDFLDPTDSSRTLEGHPAPRRVVVVARTS